VSIHPLTAYAVARNLRKPTRSDAGEVTKESTKRDEEPSLPALLVKQTADPVLEATISSRLTLVRRVVAFTNEYPWRWQAADVEASIDSCRSQAQPIVVSTARLRADAADVSGLRPRHRQSMTGTLSTPTSALRRSQRVIIDG